MTPDTGLQRRITILTLPAGLTGIKTGALNQQAELLRQKKLIYDLMCIFFRLGCVI
jgi:hypothetical protein